MAEGLTCAPSTATAAFESPASIRIIHVVPITPISSVLPDDASLHTTDTRSVRLPLSSLPKDASI